MDYPKFLLCHDILMGTRHPESLTEEEFKLLGYDPYTFLFRGRPHFSIVFQKAEQYIREEREHRER